jgi:ketosteroid isomerase-like protein
VLVEMTAPDLIATKAGNLAATASFVDKGIAKLTINVRRVQILDADTFVSTEIATVEMKPGVKPAGGTASVTDVYHKQANGSWLIVNEHVSLTAPPTTPLPVIVSFPK